MLAGLEIMKVHEKSVETYFKCHAAHRPGDYLVPKGPQYSGEKK